ncbi:MAG: hypothetical protein IJ217_01630 [Clostridia bacterium]|nr:hypothetical protein [Clostridia bacterium]
MVNFNTSRMVIFNKIIHSYLECEIFGDVYTNIGENIESFVPPKFKYLYREQYARYIEVFKDLYEWTSDIFIHEMSAFHEIALYYFLLEMESVEDNMKEDFKKIYYDSSLRKEIHERARKDKKELGNEYTIKELEEEYYHPNYMTDEIYEDVDFLNIDHLYNEQKENIPYMAKILGINLDYYFEVLPMDIKKQYVSNHITLTGEVSDFFSYMQQRINNGSLAELFWEDEKAIKEKKIHIILENLMEAYFIGKGVDISREVLVKNGQVDFKLYRSDKKEEKILIEVKKASSSYLKAGYEDQLCDYIKYSGCTNAFYLIVCFSDNDYKTATNFIKNHVYTDTYQMYINIAILDVRKKLSPSVKKAKYDKKELLKEDLKF